MKSHASCLDHLLVIVGIVMLIATLGLAPLALGDMAGGSGGGHDCVIDCSRNCYLEDPSTGCGTYKCDKYSDCPTNCGCVSTVGLTPNFCWCQ